VTGSNPFQIRVTASRFRSDKTRLIFLLFLFFADVTLSASPAADHQPQVNGQSRSDADEVLSRHLTAPGQLNRKDINEIQASSPIAR
jgi:hypothetical protein